MSYEPEIGAKAVPYSPSWVNRLTAWLARRPWPSWYFHLGLWLVLALTLIATLWVEGVYPLGTVFAVQVFIPAMIALLLAMIHFLDVKAGMALTGLRPALDLADEGYDELCFKLTTMPAWPTLLASIVSVGAIYLLGAITGERESSIEALASSPVAANLVFVMYWVGWWAFGAFAYHTVHQLRVINQIYSRHTRVHLFAMRPLYALSTVTALTAMTLVIATYGWTALNPNNLSDPVSIVVISSITLLALGVFAWPLLGARRILAREKAQRLDQISSRYEAVFFDLNQHIDDRELAEVDDLMKIISVLEMQRTALTRISTWPWHPETARSLVTVLLLPLLLWVIQYALQALLGS